MSLLAEIATRADVPLEAVMRVLTREPVSEDAKARILAVLDELDAEQTRVLQRFALAAVHDVLPRPAAAAVEPEVVDPDPEPAALQAPQAALEAPQAAQPAAVVEPAPLTQLGPVLAELADAVRELRRETDAERRERVDDLAVLIDLITKGWEGLDRRLGRLERQLARLEGAEPRRVPPVAIEPPPVPPPRPEPAPAPPPPDGDGRTVLRGRLPLVAVLALGVGVGAVAALDLPERSDVSSVVASTNRETASRRAPSLPPTAGSVLGEVATDVTTAPATTAARTAAPPPATTARTTARTTAPPSSSAATTTAATTERATGFRPSRNWAWPPAAGADYYLVEFFREGRLLYRATPTAAQVTLPESVAFTRGSYRWRVRPGRGERSDNDLQPPIVDSAFTVG